MKISIELEEQEKMEVLEKITGVAGSITHDAVKNYFESISQDDFCVLLRRALRTSCEAFFQQYMQYYIEKRSKDIFKKINQDLINEFEK